MASQASVDAIRDRAAHWSSRLNDNDLNDAEREDLQAWLLADPRHEAEFRTHNAILSMARELPKDAQARLDTYLPVIQHEAELPSSRWRWPAALAATLLVAVMATGWFALKPSTYTTRTGENRTITFDDGSYAVLNTRTQIAYSKPQTQVKQLGGKCERVVLLDGGEALFDVVHDPSCPFRVVVGNTEIQVLGTRFNVYRKPNGQVTVTVLEGKVAVRELGGAEMPSAWKREVSANQRIVFEPIGLMGDVQQIEPQYTSYATKWRDGLLVTEEERPLSEVVSEFSRYTDKQIVIRDPRIAQLYMGGAFSIRDVRATLDRIAKSSPGVVVSETGDTIALAYRSNPTK